MKTAILALLLVGCTQLPAERCVTTCGMELVGTAPERHMEYRGQPWWTCEQFQRAEDEIVADYEEKTAQHDARFAVGKACKALKGWKVEVAEVTYWPADMETVGGLTYCDQGYMLVNAVPPMLSSLAHEVGHAIQNCSPKGPADGGDSQHANWGRDGLYGAQQAVDLVGGTDEGHCHYYTDGGIADPNGIYAYAYSGPLPGYDDDQIDLVCPGIPN